MGEMQFAEWAIGLLTNASLFDGLGIIFVVSLFIPAARKRMARLFTNGNGNHVTQEQMAEHKREDGAKFAAIDAKLDVVISLLKKE